jgi:glycosyltransferase involved in cell wall biosynthesis
MGFAPPEKPIAGVSPPDLSVVIPVRNEERYIGRALASVASQTLAASSLEAVVVANGCTDRTAELVREFAVGHRELAVQLIELEQPGVAAAKNIGARAARAPVVLFLDGDSAMPPALAAHILGMRRRGVRAATIRITADSRDILDNLWFALVEVGKRVLRVRANMSFCDRDLFLAVGGFDPSLRFAEDLDFLRRVARSGVRVDHVFRPAIATSPRRIRRGPLRLGWSVTLIRWILVRWGIGRDWRY